MLLVWPSILFYRTTIFIWFDLLPEQYILEEEEDQEEGFIDQQPCNQQRNSSLDLGEPAYAHIKEEHCSVQEEEELQLKQETDPVDGEKDETLNSNPDKTVEEPVVNTSVICRGSSEPTTGNISNSAVKEKQCNPYRLNKPFKCDTCGKDFNRKANFKKHLRTHKGERPYSCSFCSKQYSQRSSLNLHLRIHTGEKPYVCETCGKDFIQRSDLTVHIRRAHTGEKPYRCKICGKCFPANNDLSVHIKIHMGHKPFTCVTCGRGFRRGCQLTMHIRREHIGEKRFICQICGKRYFNTYELSRHQRSHIKID